MNQHDEILYNLAEEFARKVRNGDEYAFTQLVELCGAFVYRYIVRRISNAEDAKEICNDVFQRLYDKLETWDESTAIIALIYKIASGKVIDWLRKHDREYFIIRKNANGEDDKTLRFLDMGKEDVLSTVLALPDTSSDIAEALEHNELMQAIHSDIGCLPKNQKEIMNRILENQEPTEIAAIMGISISTVRTQYFHAKEKLKQNMRKYQLLSAMAFLDVCDNPISDIRVPVDLSAQIVESVASKTAATATTATTATTTATATAATAAASQTTIGGLGIMANVIGTKIGVAVITAAVAASGVGVANNPALKVRDPGMVVTNVSGVFHVLRDNLIDIFIVLHNMDGLWHVGRNRRMQALPLLAKALATLNRFQVFVQRFDAVYGMEHGECTVHIHK